jgi:hypothetical protein
VEGGGFDPSPKAWQAIQYGAIPIIRKTPCWEAYREMPCVAIDAWEPEAISQKKLLEWKSAFLTDFDDERNRAAALEKLNIGFWWQKIVAAWEQQ